MKQIVLNKNWLVFIYILSFVLPINAQEKSDRDKSSYLGYVQSVKEYSAKFEIKNGKSTEEKRELSSIETFDISGKQLTVAFGQNDEKETNIYDEKGRVAEVIRKKQPYSYLVPRKVRKFDENDRLIEEVGYDEDKTLLGKYIYRYDSNGNLIEETSESAPPKKLYYNNYVRKNKYDENNRKIEEATYTKIGDEWQPEDFHVGYYKQVFLYDSKGNVIAENRIGANEKLYQTSVSSFNEKNKEDESAVFNADGTNKERTRYSYDLFDKLGNCIKETEYDWITEDGKSFFRPSKTTYRQITYFSLVEIKAFEARNKTGIKPNAKAVQNTDAEEYAIYNLLLENWLANEKIKNVIVEKFTKRELSSDDESQKLSSNSLGLSDINQSAVEDYAEKNKQRQYQLLENLFPNKTKIILIDQAEQNEFFSSKSGGGWEAFYKKYPNSQGITTLSRVGFNKDKTQAIVYIGTQSHSLAGAGYFVVLKKENGVWKGVKEKVIWVS